MSSGTVLREIAGESGMALAAMIGAIDDGRSDRGFHFAGTYDRSGVAL
jgi:predicted DNA-binding ribbon-helix-helix protein